MTPIGFIQTPFREKFGVPRQSRLVQEARGVLKLNADPMYRDAVKHLDTFSHVWLIWIFHKELTKKWRASIDTPRTNAPGRIGVFASRSPHRPNPIGMSAVKLEKVDVDAKDGVEIHLSGVDILDGTPVLDIKPYLPYADSITDANTGWVTGDIERFPVEFSEESELAIQAASFEKPHLKRLIHQMLELDPRPTSQRRAAPMRSPKSDGLRFAFRVLSLDIHWEIRRGSVYVVEARGD